MTTGRVRVASAVPGAGGMFAAVALVKEAVSRRGAGLAVAATLLFGFPVLLQAQGILTIIPGRVVNTTAGTGAVGYSSAPDSATSATLADPAAVAYDSAGNLYIADASNHVIRQVSTSGVIQTVAGNGIEGYGGDGAAATAAQLDTPTGVAVDGSGDLYIADSHNHRIRMVRAGIITTIAGTGVAGFSGDGGAATAGELSLPSGVAVDATGNVYIADTNNHRIREVSNGTIRTIAGDGEELYAGDGGAATSAALDSPTGVAVDRGGNVYIADRLNQRVREVSGGNISTLAGSSTEGFSGDGTASGAMLAKPSGVSVDAAGNVYIADTDNQRVREVGGGAIATISGTGAQGFGGDAGLATGAVLNSPHAVAPDAFGNISIADQLNARVRSGSLPALTFPSAAVGVASQPQTVTLTNTGAAALTVSAITASTGFATVAGGNCPALPLGLSPGESCTVNVAYVPTAVGSASGSIVFSGTGVVPQTILLTGMSTQAATSVALASNANPAMAGQPVTYTAVVSPVGLGTPTGTVAFGAGGVAFSTQTLAPASTTALAVTSTLATGIDSITAIYSGDSNFTSGMSAVLSQVVEDFSIALTPQPHNAAGATDQTVIPGKSVTFDFALTPLAGSFNFPIVLSATGLPPGASVTFSPQTVMPGTNPAAFTMTVQTAVSQGLLHRGRVVGGGGVALAFLMLPFMRRIRNRERQRKRLRGLTLFSAMLLGIVVLGSTTGCGTDTGFFAQQPQSFKITVTGAATASGGYLLQHSASVTLAVQ